MAHAMFKLCSGHACPAKSRFTILNALPVHMLSQVFESILLQFSIQFSNNFGSIFCLIFNDSQFAERSEAVVVGGGGGGSGMWWWRWWVVGGRAACNCLHMPPDASK